MKTILEHGREVVDFEGALIITHKNIDIVYSSNSIKHFSLIKYHNDFSSKMRTLARVAKYIFKK